MSGGAACPLAANVAHRQKELSRIQTKDAPAFFRCTWITAEPLGVWMLYQAYQAHSDIMYPFRRHARGALRVLGQPLVGISDNTALRNLSAAYELIARAGLSHERPSFGVDRVTIGNREVPVEERKALVTAFGTLLHFKKDVDIAQPRVLLVAPLSGHFAT